MPSRSLRATPSTSESVVSTDTDVLSEVADWGNQARLAALDLADGADFEHTDSAMVGDVDFLRDWLEEGPDALVGPGQDSLEGLPALEGGVSTSGSHGALSGSAEASARADDSGLSGKASASGALTGEHGQLSAGADASISDSGLRGRARVGATGEGEVGGVDLSGRADASLSGTGLDSSASASASKSGKVGDVQLSSRADATWVQGGEPKAVGSVAARKGPASLTADTDGKLTAAIRARSSDELVRQQAEFGDHTQATMRALGGSADLSLGAQRDAEGNNNLQAQAGLTGTLVEGTVRGRHELGTLADQAARVDGLLKGSVEGRLSAKGKAGQIEDGAELSGGLEAFAGAKAGAQLSTTLSWDRKDDYGPMVADFADNLPGNLDDALLDKVPESVWTRIGEFLLGTGKSDLLTAGVGVDARAGAGAEAKGSLKAQGGLVETEASLGAALGVGGGIKGKLGLNPLGLLRRAMAAGMGSANQSFGKAEALLRRLRGDPP